MSDFSIQNEGTIFVFTPLSEEAVEFADEMFADAMTWGLGYVVEHRYAAPIAEDLAERGFILE